MQIVLFIVGFILFVAIPLVKMSFLAALIDIALTVALFKIVANTQKKLKARGQADEALGFFPLYLYTTGSFLIFASAVFHFLIIQPLRSEFTMFEIIEVWFYGAFVIGTVAFFLMGTIAKQFRLSKIASMQKREREAAANKPTLADRLRDIED